MSNKYNNIKHTRANFIWNMVGSSLYAVTSLILMIIVTRVNGVDQAGIFTFAFSFACMMFIVGIYAGRTFQVTEVDKSIHNSDFILFKIICCITMLILGIIFCIIRDYDNYKNIIVITLLCYKALDAFSDSIYAIFQKNENIYQSGISLTLKAIICTIVFILVDIWTINLMAATISLVITNFLCILLYDLVKLKNYNIKYWKINLRTIQKLFLSGLSIFLFSFLIQYIINAQKYVIDICLTNNEQTYFGIIIMPATFMALCAQFIIYPFINKINVEFQSQNLRKFISLNNKVIFFTLLIGLVFVLCCATIGIPILNFIYGIELFDFTIDLIIISIGAVCFALFTILSNILIAMRKNIQQLIIITANSVITFFISLYLIENYNIFGACISYTISMFILAIIYIFTYIITTYNTRKLIAGRKLNDTAI